MKCGDFLEFLIRSKMFSYLMKTPISTLITKLFYFLIGCFSIFIHYKMFTVGCTVGGDLWEGCKFVLFGMNIIFSWLLLCFGIVILTKYLIIKWKQFLSNHGKLTLNEIFRNQTNYQTMIDELESTLRISNLSYDDAEKIRASIRLYEKLKTCKSQY